MASRKHNQARFIRFLLYKSQVNFSDVIVSDKLEALTGTNDMDDWDSFILDAVHWIDDICAESNS